MVKRQVAELAGYFRKEFDGAQDFDFIFRCCEKAEKIIHIPRVLYHWRCHMDSTAADPESKAYAFEAGRKAVEEHYKRMGIPAKVEMTERPGWYRSRLEIQGKAPDLCDHSKQRSYRRSGAVPFFHGRAHLL